MSKVRIGLDIGSTGVRAAHPAATPWCSWTSSAAGPRLRSRWTGRCTPSARETFAGTFKLVSISGTCASFLNGDQSFTLCETANK